MKRVVVGVSGASGAILGLKLILAASKTSEIHAVVSSGAKEVLRLEYGMDFEKSRAEILGTNDAGRGDHKSNRRARESALNAKNLGYAALRPFVKSDNVKDKAARCEIYKILEEIFTSANVKFYSDADLGAQISSGSFKTDAAIVAPCSINTLAKIACGLSDTLITRAAAVALKERRRLVLGVREMPFSTISLRQMSELSALGVTIAPPVIGHYAGSEARQINDFIIGKWLDAAGVENENFKRWRGSPT